MGEGKDKLYAEPLTSVEAFRFDEPVALVFEDMIQRSVPGYAGIISMTGIIGAQYARPGTRCYDLGCSLGATTISLSRHLDVKDFSIVAVDNSKAMIERCRENLAQASVAIPVDLVCADIRDIEFHDASLVTMNFTLQFLPRGERTDFIRRLYKGLLPGGALLLAEKVAAPNEEQGLITELHHAFKRANGYSDLEISQKRSALENVLVAESEADHRSRLLDIGFRHVVAWMHCLGFTAFLAVK